MGQYVPGGGLGMFLAKLGQSIPTTSETERQRAELGILRQRAEAGREQMERERQAEEQRRFEEEQLANAFDPETGTVNMERLGMGLKTSQQPGMMPRKISLGTLSNIVNSNRQNAYLANAQKKEALLEQKAAEDQERKDRAEVANYLSEISSLPPDKAKLLWEQGRQYYVSRNPRLASMFQGDFDPNAAKALSGAFLLPKDRAAIEARAIEQKRKEQEHADMMADKAVGRRIQMAMLAVARDKAKGVTEMSPADLVIAGELRKGNIVPGQRGFTLNNDKNRAILAYSLSSGGMPIPEIQRRVKSYEDFTNGKSSEELVAHDTAYGHALEAKAAIQGLQNDPVRLVNYINQWLATQRGADAPIADYKVAIKTFASEYAKALSENTGAEREDMGKIFDRVSSPQTLVAALDSAMSKVATRSGSKADKFYRNTGDNPIEKGILSDRVAEGLKKSKQAGQFSWLKGAAPSGGAGNVGRVGAVGNPGVAAPAPPTSPSAAQPVVMPVAPEGTISRDRRYIKRNGKWEPYNGQ